MAIDYSLFHFAKGTPSNVVRHTKKVSTEAALKKAYAAVDKRDGKVCQVTGVTLNAEHANPKLALERNHLDERSTEPGRRADPDNILTVSKFVHGWMQSKALLAVDAKGEETTYVSKIAGYGTTQQRERPRRGKVRCCGRCISSRSWISGSW